MATLGLTGSRKKVSKIAEQLENFRLHGRKEGPLEAERDEPVAQKPKNTSMYDPGAKPAVADVMGAIIFGNVAPDAVLAKVRNIAAPDHVGYASLKTASRPIDYLRDRSKTPITTEQYAAALVFLSDDQAMSRMASNTAATITHLESGVPWTARDFEVKEAGDMMPYAKETKPVADVSNKLLEVAFRRRKTLKRLDNMDRAILDDLILREYPVGVIAQRWGLQPDAASAFVRRALWSLVRVYEEVNAEFRAWLVTERVAEQG